MAPPLDLNLAPTQEEFASFLGVDIDELCAATDAWLRNDNAPAAPDWQVWRVERREKEAEAPSTSGKPPWLAAQETAADPIGSAMPEADAEILVQASPGEIEDDYNPADYTADGIPSAPQADVRTSAVQAPQAAEADARASATPATAPAEAPRTDTNTGSASPRASSPTGYRSVTYDDINDMMPEIARRVLGPENPSLSSHEQLCWGNHGSTKVENGAKRGVWFDHEADTGGGWLQLLLHKGVIRLPGEAYDWLKREFSVEVEQEHDSRRRKVVAEYIYTDEDRKPLGKKLRWEPKTFSWQRADGAGGWAGGKGCMSGVRRVLYLTPDLVARPTETVFEVEGEKDAENGRDKLGLLTTCNPDGGSKTKSGKPGKWRPEFSEQLRGRDVVVIPDNDEVGRDHAQTIARALIAVWCTVRVVSLPGEVKDLSDWIAAGGTREQLDALVAEAPFAEIAEQAAPEGEAAVPKSKKEEREAKKQNEQTDDERWVAIGSDIEIARKVIADLKSKHGETIFDDGDVYHYNGTRWAALNHEDLRLAVHPYDGLTYLTPEGKLQAVKLSRSRVDSVLSEMRAMLTQRDFFADARTGINCASGFITFGKAGEPDAELPSLAPHNPDHRCRHVLPGKWRPDMSEELPSDSLLHKLLDGVFKGDVDAAEKVKLVRQIAGCAALGYATKLLRPKAIICHGESAENGKSQVLDVLRGVLPKSAIASVPVTKLGDQSFLVRLAGKTLNATDELKGTAAIEGDTFKACVTGEMVTARDLYRSAIEFRPVALNVFATNVLPSFRGGFDRGVLRRLLLLPFNRVIPVEERIENIGTRIIEEEADLLLAFAVAGASDLIRERNFTVPSTSETALKDWVRLADPVMGWAAARVRFDKPGGTKSEAITSADAHRSFEAWAVAAGYRREHIPSVGGFVQRLRSIPRIYVKHGRAGNSLVGFTILRDDEENKE
jgi:P4 family phage/plasmid primase-like protien